MKIDTILLLLCIGGVAYFLLRDSGITNTLPGNVGPFVPAFGMLPPPPLPPGAQCQVPRNDPPGMLSPSVIDGVVGANGTCYLAKSWLN